MIKIRKEISIINRKRKIKYKYSEKTVKYYSKSNNIDILLKIRIIKQTNHLSGLSVLYFR